MLATATISEGGRPDISVLDLGVSRDGRLAQMPDVIDLGPQMKLVSEPLAASFSMPILHLDPAGLTINGAVLDLQTSHTPYLFESATGQLGLYFRGAGDDQFYVAHYNTLTEKARYTIDLQAGGYLTFMARSTEPELDNLSISVRDDSAGDADHCIVVIEGLALKESWHQLSRNPQQLADIINGQSREYDYDALAVSSRVPSRLDNGSVLVRVMSSDPNPGPIPNGQALSPDKPTLAPRWLTAAADRALIFDYGQRIFHDEPEKFEAEGDLTMEAWVYADPGQESAPVQQRDLWGRRTGCALCLIYRFVSQAALQFRRYRP